MVDEELWNEMIQIEPQLEYLFLVARRRGEYGVHRPSECANVVWYGRDGMKRQMSQLVGYEARDPRLATNIHYDCAYEKIYWALPACNEYCDGIEEDDD